MSFSFLFEEEEMSFSSFLEEKEMFFFFFEEKENSVSSFFEKKQKEISFSSFFSFFEVNEISFSIFDEKGISFYLLGLLLFLFCSFEEEISFSLIGGSSKRRRSPSSPSLRARRSHLSPS